MNIHLFVAFIFWKNIEKKGYGTKLINYAKEKLKTLGYSKVFLWTEEIPTYYEKLGFNYVQDVLKNDKTGYRKLYSIDI